ADLRAARLEAEELTRERHAATLTLEGTTNAATAAFALHRAAQRDLSALVRRVSEIQTEIAAARTRLDRTLTRAKEQAAKAVLDATPPPDNTKLRKAAEKEKAAIEAGESALSLAVERRQSLSAQVEATFAAKCDAAHDLVAFQQRH